MLKNSKSTVISGRIFDLVVTLSLTLKVDNSQYFPNNRIQLEYFSNTRQFFAIVSLL